MATNLGAFDDRIGVHLRGIRTERQHPDRRTLEAFLITVLSFHLENQGGKAAKPYGQLGHD